MNSILTKPNDDEKVVNAEIIEAIHMSNYMILRLSRLLSAALAGVDDSQKAVLVKTILYGKTNNLELDKDWLASAVEIVKLGEKTKNISADAQLYDAALLTQFIPVVPAGTSKKFTFHVNDTFRYIKNKINQIFCSVLASKSS
ncbi:MAG: hypothetical protein A2X93_07900 [Deltaproteobacteria bacterium GWC2_56_8]|nr:MAG: hypothetical protein A2X93_07900 [Deltaproteobacteria bacterium GWC2_56_8]